MWLIRCNARVNRRIAESRSIVNESVNTENVKTKESKRKKKKEKKRLRQIASEEENILKKNENISNITLETQQMQSFSSSVIVDELLDENSKEERLFLESLIAKYRNIHNVYKEII